MKDPEFLTLDDLLTLHASRIEKYGGSMGVRDMAALSAALGMPSVTFGGAFLHPTIPEMAAAYLFHVSQAHGFVDGNKRAALAAALAFLSLNDYDLVADDLELYSVCIGVADGTRSKAQVGVFFSENVRSRVFAEKIENRCTSCGHVQSFHVSVLPGLAKLPCAAGNCLCLDFTARQ
jgi:death-on-curing protein